MERKGKMERLTHKARYEAGYKANKNVSDWECIDKLGRLEDLEEQGKLLKLPCAVGDMVYRINKGARAKLIVMRVRSIKIFLVGKILSVKIECVEDIYGGEYICLAEKIGKTIFLTREAAEAALMEG